MSDAEKERAKTYLQVRNFATGEIATKVDVTGKSERAIERIERGMLMNMNTDEWCVELDHPDADA